MNGRKTSSQNRNTGNYSAENRRYAREKRKKAGKIKARIFLVFIISYFFVKIKVEWLGMLKQL